MTRKTSVRIAFVLVLVVATVFSPFVGLVAAQEDPQEPTTTPDGETTETPEETDDSEDESDSSDGETERPEWWDEYDEEVQAELVDLIERNEDLDFTSEHLRELADSRQEQLEQEQEEEQQAQDGPTTVPGAEDAEQVDDEPNTRKVLAELTDEVWVSNVEWGEDWVEITVESEKDTVVGVYDANKLDAGEGVQVRPYTVKEGTNVIRMDGLKEHRQDLTVVIQTAAFDSRLEPLSNPEESFLDRGVQPRDLWIAGGSSASGILVSALIIAWSNKRKANKSWTRV